MRLPFGRRQPWNQQKSVPGYSPSRAIYRGESGSGASFNYTAFRFICLNTLRFFGGHGFFAHASQILPAAIAGPQCRTALTGFHSCG